MWGFWLFCSLSNFLQHTSFLGNYVGSEAKSMSPNLQMKTRKLSVAKPITKIAQKSHTELSISIPNIQTAARYPLFGCSLSEMETWLEDCWLSRSFTEISPKLFGIWGLRPGKGQSRVKVGGSNIIDSRWWPQPRSLKTYKSAIKLIEIEEHWFGMPWASMQRTWCMVISKSICT